MQTFVACRQAATAGRQATAAAEGLLLMRMPLRGRLGNASGSSDEPNGTILYYTILYYTILYYTLLYYGTLKTPTPAREVRKRKVGRPHAAKTSGERAARGRVPAGSARWVGCRSSLGR